MMIERTCPHCGEPVLEGALFCLDCGVRILGAAPTAGRRRAEGSLMLGPAGYDEDLDDLSPGAYMWVVEGVDRGKQFILPEKPEVLIGRDDADLCLTDPFVSRRHAQVRSLGRRLHLDDLDSINGTFVNDVPAQGQELIDGDLIEIGYTTLIFRVKR